MRIIHLSYNIPKPNYTDAEAWLRRISFSVVVMESMTAYAEVFGIYHINWKGRLTKNKVTYCFPGFRAWQLLLPIQFNRYVKQLKPDVVIVHGLIFPWQVIMLHWQVGSGVKIIAQHHAEKPLKDIRQYLQRWADRYITAYLFSSLELGMRWVEKGQIRNARKINEIMGTSSTFHPIDKEEAKSVTQISGDKVYLWVGSLIPRKDPLTLVRAFKKFLAQNARAKLYIIFQENDLLEEVRSLVNGCEGITLVGEVLYQDLLYWYNSADFIVSTSYSEGSGIAVCEGLSCGCIPVLSNIPSFKWMTKEGNLGLHYKVGEFEDLCSALIKSTRLDLTNERHEVLKYYSEKLSPEAAAKEIYKVVKA